MAMLVAALPQKRPRRSFWVLPFLGPSCTVVERFILQVGRYGDVLPGRISGVQNTLVAMLVATLPRKWFRRFREEFSSPRATLFLGLTSLQSLAYRGREGHANWTTQDVLPGRISGATGHAPQLECTRGPPWLSVGRTRAVSY